MNRRTFLKASTATLASIGILPKLPVEAKHTPPLIDYGNQGLVKLYIPGKTVNITVTAPMLNLDTMEIVDNVWDMGEMHFPEMGVFKDPNGRIPVTELSVVSITWDGGGISKFKPAWLEDEDKFQDVLYVNLRGGMG